MRPFDYHRAATPAEAVALLGERPEGSYLGGGTNLVDLMRLGVARPAALVDVTSALPGEVVETEAGGLLVGAAVRNSALAVHPLVRERYPVVSQALLAGASGQLRNMATVGGNLLQRTRCLYFQDVTKPCNKREPGSGCPAIDGIHRDLAILGTSDSCIATHPSDLAVALAALDATVHVEGPGGQRVLALDDFYRLPGDDPSRDTTLDHADLITGVELPPAGGLAGTSGYRKVRDRASYAFAVVSVAAAVTTDSGVVSDVRLAFGGVAHRPWRARVAERALAGQPLDAAAVRSAVGQEMAAARLLPDNAFKATLCASVAAELLPRLGSAGGDPR